MFVSQIVVRRLQQLARQFLRPESSRRHCEKLPWREWSSWRDGEERNGAK
jgi:hypothetical protein